MARIPLCELLTKKEAAEVAKVSPKTIDRRVKAGKLPKRNKSGAPRFWVKDLEKVFSEVA